jgi:uncharacterized protein YidB (DUF937 family)
MGLFDSVVGSVLGQMGGGGAVEDAITKALTQGQVGGLDLNSIADKMRQNGFGEVIDSWIGHGPNKEIAPDEVHQALGPDTIAQIAQQFGLDPAMITQLLSQFLPGIVDKLTPHGKLPV